MHGDIFVISRKGSTQGFDEYDLLELFGEDKAEGIYPYEDDAGENDAKSTLFSILRRVVGGSFTGNQDGFSLAKDIGKAYASSVIGKMKEYFANLSVDRLALGYAGAGLRDAIEPYRWVYVVTPDGEPTTLDEFLRCDYKGDELYVENVFDYKY